ncbi:Lipoate-protein ligase A [Mycobacteroides abscessus subsp. abscessus]|nr:Lipoate-protein ligase A [Mycobacteroides abscessus subsp. abscessus]
MGGHAAAYHSGCLIIDHFQADADAVSGNMKRFTEFGQMFTDSLRTLDVQAQMGEIEGEYCPGEHSVHILLPDGTSTKIIGTAQRVVSGAWWFSTGIVVTNSEPLRDVTTAVYRNLGLPLKPSTVGALTDANPLIAIEDVEDAVLESLNQRGYC